MGRGGEEEKRSVEEISGPERVEGMRQREAKEA